MTWMRHVTSLYELLFQRQRREAELNAEVAAYFEIMVARNMEQGMSLEEARRSARLEFEGPEQVKEKVREPRLGATVEATLQDVRYAARIMRKSPAFTALIVFTLAVGIREHCGLQHRSRRPAAVLALS